MERQEKNVINTNRLIAEFMGISERTTKGMWASEQLPDDYIRVNNIFQTQITTHSTSQLKYSTSWDWIIPVVEKIESLGYIFQIHKQHAEYFKPFEASGCPEFGGDTKLAATHAAVVSFIEYWNKKGE